MLQFALENVPVLDRVPCVGQLDGADLRVLVRGDQMLERLVALVQIVVDGLVPDLPWYHDPTMSSLLPSDMVLRN